MISPGKVFSNTGVEKSNCIGMRYSIVACSSGVGSFCCLSCSLTMILKSHNLPFKLNLLYLPANGTTTIPVVVLLFSASHVKNTINGDVTCGKTFANENEAQCKLSWAKRACHKPTTLAATR